MLEQVLGCLARLAVWANSENNLFIFEMVREMLNLDLHLSLRGTFHSNGYKLSSPNIILNLNHGRALYEEI